VARKLAVTRTTAMRWHRAFGLGGRDGLARRGRRGRPRKLTARELSQVLRALPRAWTVDHVALEIERRTGVHYHPGHLWRILSAWGWTRTWQRPPAAALRDPDGNPLLLSEGSSGSAAGTAPPRRRPASRSA
jgi:transposase